MADITIFSKPEFGRIGVLTAQDGTPWFNAVDVCKVLGYGNVTAALRKHVKEKDLTKCETLTSGGMQKVNFVDDVDVRITDTKQNGKLRKVNFVNESGLYSLILGSKLPTDASEQGGWDRVHNDGELPA